MSDFISREKLWKRITSTYDEGLSLDELRSEIDEMPTAEPVKHGHWISESQTKFEKMFFSSRVFKCSVCGNYLDFDGVNVGRGSANYCPNCGAKMDVSDTDVGRMEEKE